MDDQHPFKKRRKGLQQRQQADADDMDVPSSLHALLLLYLAQGIFSGAQVHAIAQAGQSDVDKASQGHTLKDLKSIASLSHSKNLGRSLLAKMSKVANLPEPLEVHIPMKGAIDTVPSNSILLPHEMFSALYEISEAWTRSIFFESKLKLFWKGFQGHPALTNHPILKVPSYQNKVIPVALHGDEVPVLGVGKIWCKSVLSFSWFSLMACAAGTGFLDAHLYIWGIFEKYVLPTKDVFWLITRWSFEAMLKGKWPSTDWRGEPYAPGSKEAQRAGTYLANGYKASGWRFRLLCQMVQCP